MIISISDRFEKNVRKEENTGYQNFSFFPAQRFQKHLFFQGRYFFQNCVLKETLTS